MTLSLPLYHTEYGKAYVGDATVLLQHLPDASVDLVLTSPPFALQRQKEYGNLDQNEYVDWLLSFSPGIKRVMKETGSFVLDLGGAYQRGRPIRSLYNYRVLLKLCDEQGWNLAEEFFWYNPSKLPSPIEWVNKRKIRAKDAVNTIWWLSKNDFPKADITQVLTPYSDRMKLLLKNPEKYYTAKKRPSGHDIGRGFGRDKGGAIPPNLFQCPEPDEVLSNFLEIPNTESNSQYLRCCQIVELDGHPARFPQRIPDFFIKFLTSPGDTVLDIFSGSNTTGASAEQNGRRWIAFEIDHLYQAVSAFRFLARTDENLVRSVYAALSTRPDANIRISQQLIQPYLLEEQNRYSTDDPKEGRQKKE